MSETADINASINNKIFLSKEYDSKIEEDFIVYQLKIKKFTIRPNKFFLVENNEIIQMAKKSGMMVFIGQGNDVHISDKTKHAGEIVQTLEHYNMIFTNNTKFKIKYIKLPETGKYSITFKYTQNTLGLDWVPIDRNLCTKNESFPEIRGQYNHSPIKSRRNTVLENPYGSIKFIVRKMKTNLYEIECSKMLDQTVAFALAISQIIGPFEIIDSSS